MTATRKSAVKSSKSKANASKAGSKAGRKPAKPATKAGRFRAAPPVLPVPRTAEQIGVTPIGPRPVPELTAARRAAHPDLSSQTIDNGLRVIAVRKPGTPLIEVRLRVPFGGTSVSHSARAEVLARYPRLGLIEEFVACFEAQAERKPGSTAGRFVANPFEVRNSRGPYACHFWTTSRRLAPASQEATVSRGADE